MHMPASAVRRAAVRPAAAALVIAALILAACSGKDKSGSGALGSQSGSPTVSPTPPCCTPPGPTTSPTGTTTDTATASGPVIIDFSIKQQPSCPIVGTSDAPFHKDGVDIIVQWKTGGGVTGVGLSLDSPPDFFKQNGGNGSLGNYGPSGQMELSFQCQATNGPNTTHTYTLDTIGGGRSTQKSLKVTVPTSP